jgi:hypothetical protein
MQLNKVSPCERSLSYWYVHKLCNMQLNKVSPCKRSLSYCDEWIILCILGESALAGHNVTAVRNLRADSKDKRLLMLNDGEVPEPCGFDVPRKFKAYPTTAPVDDRIAQDLGWLQWNQ